MTDIAVIVVEIVLVEAMFEQLANAAVNRYEVPTKEEEGVVAVVQQDGNEFLEVVVKIAPAHSNASKDP